MQGIKKCFPQKFKLVMDQNVHFQNNSRKTYDKKYQNGALIVKNELKML
jgi:hypothetical protein